MRTILLKRMRRKKCLENRKGRHLQVRIYSLEPIAYSLISSLIVSFFDAMSGRESKRVVSSAKRM